MDVLPLVTGAVFFAELGFTYWLDYLNISHLRRTGAVIPPEFEGHIDQEALTRASDYTAENMRLGAVSSAVANIAVFVFVFAGVLPAYDSWIVSLGLPFVASGLVFFLALSFASTVLSVPFSLYRAFVLEKRYGFSTMTFGTWAGDFVKSLGLSAVITGALIAGTFWLVQESPRFWWLWGWGLFFSFSVFLMYVSPYLIEPLFNKFTPIEDGELVRAIEGVASGAGIRVDRVLRMDASRRTRHTNAYFTGIGRVKRIVMYDTLLEKLQRSEILSVLAHEIGHWRKRHVLKTLLVMESVSFVAMLVSYFVLESGILSRSFGIDGATFYAEVVLLLFIWSLVLFPLSPIAYAFSRRHETEADRFSWELTGEPESMVSSLVKLSKDNLSNLHPHPLYVTFHYSHPPVLERIRRIREGSRGEGKSA